MKGDFTRDIFDETKHYTRVLMQQGRVQLDTDWNAQVAMDRYHLEVLAADIIGPHGGPQGNTGFQIIGDQAPSGDFFIGPGRYYVDGILCELDPETLRISNVTRPSTLQTPGLTLDGWQLAEDHWIGIADGEGTWHRMQIASVDPEKNTFTVKGTLPDNPVQIRRVMTYRGQPEYPAAVMGAEGFYLAYLDVWERHITYLEDSQIREVALGGPDTSSRAKVVWQVKLMSADECEDVGTLDSLSSARMKAQLKPSDPGSDPCIIAPDSKFRGGENQLYRVEIHRSDRDTNGNPQEWTFKWSRDNASIAAIWLDNDEEGGLKVSNTRGFAEEQWVEVTSETDELRNEPGQFCKIVKIDGSSLFLDPQPAWDEDSVMKVRCWDQRKVSDIKLLDGAVLGEERVWLELENGLEVYFETGGRYRSGDYWLIPARVVNGSIEWRVELNVNGTARSDANGNEIPRALKPNGVKHHFAPLAMLTWNGNTLRIKEDCRCSFRLVTNCPPSRGGQAEAEEERAVKLPKTTSRRKRRNA